MSGHIAVIYIAMHVLGLWEYFVGRVRRSLEILLEKSLNAVCKT